MRYEILQKNDRFFGLLHKWEVMESSEDPKRISRFKELAKQMPFLYRVKIASESKQNTD